jgi:hypothetical protein
MNRLVLTTKNVAAFCGLIALYSIACSGAAAQGNDNAIIKTDSMDKLIPAAAISDKEIEKEASHDIASSVIELKNGIVVPAVRLDGSAAKKAATGAIIYGRGVYVTEDGIVRSNGKIVKKLAQGERLSISDLEGWSREIRELPSQQVPDASSPAPEGSANTQGSLSEPPTLPASITRDPELTGIPDDQVQPEAIPVTTSGVPESSRAGMFYKCPDQIQVTARILPNTTGSRSTNRDSDMWIVNGDGVLAISESELDISGGVYFPTCYYVGTRGVRSIFTTLEVDRNVYKICRKDTSDYREKHSFFCSPDEDWLNAMGNASLHNEEMDLDDQGTGGAADIQYTTQNGQATLGIVNGRGALAILRGVLPRRGTCSTALDNPVDAIPQSALNPGAVVCYRTGLNRYGYLKVIGHLPGKPDSIVFSYKTFAKLD